jgi:hypothetical protein
VSNAFASFAEENKPAHVQRKERISAARRERAMERAQNEQTELNKIAAAWRRARLDELLAGPYGHQIKALRSFLRTMTLDSAPDLVALIAGADWLHECDADTKFDCWHMVSRAIGNLRLRNGMAFADDPLDPDETNAVLDIRRALYGY